MKLIKPGLFELNPHRRVQSERIGEGEHHLVIIDDLFLHPREISNLMNELIYSDDEEIRQFSPGYRCVMNFPLRDQIYREVFQLHYKVYKIQQLVEQRPSFDQYFDQ